MKTGANEVENLVYENVRESCNRVSDHETRHRLSEIYNLAGVTRNLKILHVSRAFCQECIKQWFLIFLRTRTT